jgi:hypothetical protein
MGRMPGRNDGPGGHLSTWKPIAARRKTSIAGRRSGGRNVVTIFGQFPLMRCAALTG